jgi:ketosteroid isomerase-like protein
VLKRLVRSRVAAVFAMIERGDTDGVLAGTAEDVEHRFAGDHPLGGQRTGREEFRRWFERLHRLFPSLAFDLRTIAVTGPPWDLLVTVEWLADVTPVAGPAYRNQGAHLIRLRRGRVTSVHAYEDSQAVARACELMRAAGVAEADAPVIGVPY